jgi:hypothetical protein
MLLLEPWKQVTVLLQHQQSGVLLVAVAPCDCLWEKLFFEPTQFIFIVTCCYLLLQCESSCFFEQDSGRKQ